MCSCPPALEGWGASVVRLSSPRGGGQRVEGVSRGVAACALSPQPPSYSTFLCCIVSVCSPPGATAGRADRGDKIFTKDS